MSVTSRPPLYQDLNYLGAASVYAEEVFSVIGAGPIFEQFSRREIEALCQFMHCFAASRDTVLLREGDTGDYQLIILTGRVSVRKQNSEGQLIDLATAGPGTSLGEMSLIDGAPRFASCVTTEPTDFAVMTRADLNEFMVIHPRLANKLFIKLMQILVFRLRDTGNRLLSNYLNPVS
jgi:CRP/FNR family transcriptional regulator, cyclic AMP receptor protein